MTIPVIQIANMSQQYTLGGEIINALNKVSLTVQSGDFISIIGPSGSGKSTLMNMIGCLDQPDFGTYYIDGEDVSDLYDAELATVRNEKIGFIFQNFNLIATLTAEENVELPLIYRGIKTKERKLAVAEALKKVGLRGRGKHLPSQLSGGQQQRVAIARALVGQPKLLLADEPTGALDSKTGQEIIRIMESLNKQGITIIMITHDLDIAHAARRILHIHDGQLTEEGATAT